MGSELAPNLYQLPIPLPGNPLGRVNAYAIRSDEGIFLVDCGWNTPEALAALAEQLDELGGAREVRQILITHIHPDHFGLAEYVAGESGARMLMHQLEAAFIGARYEDVKSIIEQMSSWLRVNGVPPGELEEMSAGSLEMVRRVGTRSPDVLLKGDEIVSWGDYRFEVLWTPGHSAGLICLYDRSRHLLISSDHILERISPHIGLHAQSLGNPLADYLRSLDVAADLSVDLVLPGHGGPFGNLAGRIEELREHHRSRLAHIRDLVKDHPRTAYQIAGQLAWKGREDGWSHLAAFERRMAVTEVLAHLEFLTIVGQIGKRHQDGVVFYCEKIGHG